ncbi:hypothetical protein Ciccas_014495, partial [Cichlidogyrus casuarinus]
LLVEGLLRALGVPNSEKFSHPRLGAKSRSHYRPVRICFDLEATAALVLNSSGYLPKGLNRSLSQQASSHCCQDCLSTHKYSCHPNR